MSKNQHVVPQEGNWVVRGEGNQRVTSMHATQAEAIEAAREIARNQGSKIVIHGRDGHIRDRESHGNGPNSRSDRRAKRGSQNLHVIPHDADWAVRNERSERAISLHATQAEAIEAAREIARNRGSEIIIHRADGRVRERESHGTNPLPSKSPREVLFPRIPTITDKKMIEKAVKEVISEFQFGSERESRT